MDTRRTVRRGVKLAGAVLLGAGLSGLPRPALPQDPPPAPPRPIRAEAGGTADEKKAPGTDLPPGVLARVNGRDITVNDYVGYLFASIGKSRLDELVDRLLVEEEAERLGISVKPEQVETALQERIDRTIQGLYQGNRQSFEENLAARRMTLEDYRAKLRQDLYYEMLWTEAILKTREVSDADLQRHFERVHGEGGVQLVLRHVLFRPSSERTVPPGGPDAAGERSEAAAVRAKAEARGRAEKVLREIQGGLDFVQAVRQHSDDAFTKANDGRIPLYRKGFFGESFHEAVARLSPESPLSGVIESPRGFHLVQLVERRVTRFEDVKDEIEKAVREEAPSVRDRHELILRLRARARIEGL